MKKMQGERGYYRQTRSFQEIRRHRSAKHNTAPGGNTDVKSRDTRDQGSRKRGDVNDKIVTEGSLECTAKHTMGTEGSKKACSGQNGEKTRDRGGDDEDEDEWKGGRIIIGSGETEHEPS